jgi:hypothetical protein
MKKRRGGRRLGLLILTVAAVATAAGIAYAAIPDGSGVIHGCYSNTSGAVRVIDTAAGQKCSSAEKALDWNQAGQPGPAGPQGAKGDPGAPGTNGTNGTNGKDGVSVTTAAEPTGTNCAAGGVQLTAASGVSYVCNGKAGADGTNGTNGTNGSNGQDGVSVTSAVEPAGTNCASGGSKFTAANNNVTYACNGAAGTGGGSGWSLSGNAGTTPGTNFLGTTDNQPLELDVNGGRALRLEPGKNAAFPSSPNLIGGFSGNSVGVGVSGATIGGGGRGLNGENSVTASFGTVAGGHRNTASGFDASVAGGQSNTASGLQGSTVAGGEGNFATGTFSTVAGGAANTASGTKSFAAGGNAKATHDGSFVWADDSGIGFGSTAANQFSARATGGVRFVTAIDAAGAPTAGVQVAAGSGSWASLSDRALKRNFARVDGSWILARLAGLPISSWSYKAQKPSIRHLGPTAQDFARAFGLGEDNRHIDSIDSEGVSLAGIKALYKLVQEQQREIRALQRALHVRRAR